MAAGLEMFARGKRAKSTSFTFHRTSRSRCGTALPPGPLVAFTSIRTRRGKLSYHEVDASSHYMSSDDEATPKRKVPKAPLATNPTPPTANMGLEQDWVD